MEWTINWEKCNRIYGIPKIIINRYMQEVNITYLQVILLIFSWEREEGSVSELSKALNIEESKMMDILDFWAQEGLISLQKEEIIKIIETKDRELKQKESTPLSLKKDEMATLTLEDDMVKFLLNEVQNMLGRTLTYTECNVLISIYKLYGMPCDVVLMLIQYCVAKGKDNFHYIRKIAVDWVNKNIITFERAEQHILGLERQATSCYAVQNLLGIRDRDLTSKEKELADQWIGKLQMPLEFIVEAFERCVTNTGKISFPYMNKILQGWKEKGFTTLQEVALEQDRRKKATEKEESYQSYQVNQMEEMMMNYIPVYKKEEGNEI